MCNIRKLRSFKHKEKYPITVHAVLKNISMVDGAQRRPLILGMSMLSVIRGAPLSGLGVRWYNQVSDHVKGVAVRMDSDNFFPFLENLEKPGVVNSNNPS